MHKAALLDLGGRPGWCNLSLDVSSARNECDRAAAARAVQAMVPELLPRVRGGLGTAAVRVHVGRGGSRTPLPKDQGGDQGDALTNQVFPLCYKHVADSVAAAAGTEAEPGRGYCYQDDFDVVCAPAGVAQAVAACAQAGLRANPA